MTPTRPALSRAELEAVRARCEAATPGPWEVVEKNDEYAEKDECFVGMQPWNPAGWWENDSSVMGRPTTTFIAHARTDIPALLATVDALETVLQDLMELTQNPPEFITDRLYWPEVMERARALLGDSEPSEQPLGDDV